MSEAVAVVEGGKKIESRVEYRGLWFDERTPLKVRDIIVNAYKSNRRIRVFYGDRTTGRDWMEEYDVIGYVGRSTGTIQIPLLINNARSMGGGAILDDCIVKITIDKNVVYEHPTYHMPTLEVETVNVDKDFGTEYGVIRFQVIGGDGQSHARFRKRKMAQDWVEFMQGKRNRK